MFYGAPILTFMLSPCPLSSSFSGFEITVLNMKTYTVVLWIEVDYKTFYVHPPAVFGMTKDPSIMMVYDTVPGICRINLYSAILV